MGDGSRPVVKAEGDVPMLESRDRAMELAETFLRPTLAKLYEHFGPVWTAPACDGKPAVSEGE